MKCLAVVGALAALSTTASAQTVLRYADQGPNRGIRAENMAWFAEELEKRTDGRVTIEFHWAGSLLGGADIVEGVSNGVADMGTAIGVYSPQDLYAYRVGDLPIPAPDDWSSARALLELARTDSAVKQEFDDLGLTLVTNYMTGPNQLVCNDSGIESIEDIEGVTFRSVGVVGQALADLGGVAVQLPLTEAYQGLDNGLTTCSMVYGYTIKSYKLYEVANELVKINFGTLLGSGMVINKDSLARLEEQDRQTLLDLGVDFIDRYAQDLMAANEEVELELVEGIEGNEFTVIEMNDADYAAMEVAGRPHVESWIEGADFDGRALLDRYQQLIEKYDQERDEQGYPWEREAGSAD